MIFLMTWKVIDSHRSWSSPQLKYVTGSISWGVLCQSDLDNIDWCKFENLDEVTHKSLQLLFQFLGRHSTEYDFSSVDVVVNYAVDEIAVKHRTLSNWKRVLIKENLKIYRKGVTVLSKEFKISFTCLSRVKFYWKKACNRR